jgi:preprotein translocase subunit SecE
VAKDAKTEAKQSKLTKKSNKKRPSLLARRKDSSKKSPKKKSTDKLTIGNNPVTRYLKGAWYELKHVTWPDRSETTRLTIGVIIYSLFFALFIALVDYVFDLGFERFII